LNLVFPAYRLIEEASDRHRGGAARGERRRGRPGDKSDEVAAFHAGALARGVEVEEHTPDDSDVAYWSILLQKSPTEVCGIGI
jgi:hypothetical protein